MNSHDSIRGEYTIKQTKPDYTLRVQWTLVRTDRTAEYTVIYVFLKPMEFLELKHVLGVFVANTSWRESG